MSPRALHLMSLYQIAFVALGAAVCLFVWPEAAFGVLAGGGLMAGNFWFLRSMVSKIFAPGEKPKARYAILLGAKFFVVLGALALLVVVLRVHPLGIALGMMSLFLGIGGGMAHHVFIKDPSPERG